MVSFQARPIQDLEERSALFTKPFSPTEGTLLKKEGGKGDGIPPFLRVNSSLITENTSWEKILFDFPFDEM